MRGGAYHHQQHGGGKMASTAQRGGGMASYNGVQQSGIGAALLSVRVSAAAHRHRSGRHQRQHGENGIIASAWRV